MSARHPTLGQLVRATPHIPLALSIALYHRLTRSPHPVGALLTCADILRDGAARAQAMADAPPPDLPAETARTNHAIAEELHALERLLRAHVPTRQIGAAA
jgi:hypothetical protein